MGELLASRRAGRKLGLVVALLILPALVLWSIYFQEARVNLLSVERAKAGLALAEQIAPLYYGKTDIAGAERRMAILSAEVKLGISDGVRFNDAFPIITSFANNMQSDSHRNATDKRGIMVSAGSGFLAHKGQFDRAILVSKLTLEPDDRSNNLIRATFVDLPELVRSYEATLDYMAQKLADEKLQEDEFRDIMRSMGKLERARDDFSNLISAAVPTNNSDKSSADLQGLAANVKKSVDDLNYVTSLAQSATGQFTMMTYLQQTRANNNLSTDAAHLTRLSSEQIAAKLSERQHAMWSKFLMLTAAGSGLAFAGLGLAIYLFKRTLTQLDSVEQAKRESDDMANQLAGINAEMATLNGELEVKINALRIAQEELLKKGRMEQLGQLTATIAHELRNPLGAVRTSAFLLQRRLKGLGINAETQFDRINNGISRCDNTITQLLDFSRTKKISAKRANLDDWLAHCVEEAAQQIHADVQIECVLSVGDSEVTFDGARLERAIVNLMINAAEAMVGKGKDKGQMPAEPKITLQSRLENGWVAISVIDNGPGISAEHLQKIREPLFTTKNFGTGLGIPAVEQIATQHNGRLSIASEVGQGACFTIWLPEIQSSLKQPETVKKPS